MIDREMEAAPVLLCFLTRLYALTTTPTSKHTSPSVHATLFYPFFFKLRDSQAFCRTCLYSILKEKPLVSRFWPFLWVRLLGDSIIGADLGTQLGWISFSQGERLTHTRHFTLGNLLYSMFAITKLSYT